MSNGKQLTNSADEVVNQYGQTGFNFITANFSAPLILIVSKWGASFTALTSGLTSAFSAVSLSVTGLGPMLIVIVMILFAILALVTVIFYLIGGIVAVVLAVKINPHKKNLNMKAKMMSAFTLNWVYVIYALNYIARNKIDMNAR